MSDAIDLLTADHDKVRALFSEFRDAKDADDRDEMRSLQAKIFDELETHTRIEEEFFYPAVRDLNVPELTETVKETAVSARTRWLQNQSLPQATSSSGRDQPTRKG